MTSPAFTGTKYVPALAHNPDGNYRARIAEWPLPTLGTMIVQCMAHAMDAADNGGCATVFEVWVEFNHVADAASLEAALAIVSDKYMRPTPTFVGTWPRPLDGDSGTWPNQPG